jgi:methylenetetrahydrofolate reductase (NADPH)
MRISNLFGKSRRVFSFEVFPPKRDGDLEGVFATIGELKALKPDFVSVTYGAGGSTRDMTVEIAKRLKSMGLTTLVHLTCVGQSKDETRALLDQLKQAGIDNILALRGDPPRGEKEFKPHPEGFHHANELVEFIVAHYDFCVGAAAYPEVHPEAASADEDFANLKRKCDAGAEFLITQLFFDNARYFSFVEQLRGRGVWLPVMPGIMPVLDAKSLARFASFGSTVPKSLKAGLAAVGEDAEKEREVGIGFAIEQCKDLLEFGAPGLHLYTMNKAWAAVRIHEALKKP